MAYKYLNDDGLKAYTKKVKGAIKDLNTPIAISRENTTESKAQNVRNIADFVAKAKAAGIADVNGMVVTCLIDNNYSGVGYLYGDNYIQGVLIKDDLIDNMCFTVTSIGAYNEISLITSYSSGEVTSGMLDIGARKPIILTPETTEVDEETYQKLLSDDVDVVFKTTAGNLCKLTFANFGISDTVNFTCLSIEGNTMSDFYIYGYSVAIDKNSPHICHITEDISNDFDSFISEAGYLKNFILSPVLQEIDLRGTDAERKTKLDQFETDWKALTGANDMKGARFMGRVDNSTGEGGCSVLFTFDYATNVLYYGCTMLSDTDKKIVSYRLNKNDGSLSITPLFSHLEPVNIFTLDASSFHKMNLDNLNAYKSNLEQLGVDTSKSFQVPFTDDGNTRVGNLQYEAGLNKYIGVSYESRTSKVFRSEIDATGKYTETLLAFDTDVKQVNTPVPLTATTSTNKTQLDLFLSKVPNAQVMHCTYKDVYAGTLHKIGTDWFGLLVKNTNNYEDAIQVKLQADGTLIEGTTSLAQVNAKLDNIIG